MKKFFITMLIIIMIFFTFGATQRDENSYTKAELEALIENLTNRQESAHNMAEAARELGYDETHAIITLAQSEWWCAQDKIDYYLDIYENLVAAEKETMADKSAEYPTATKVWMFLKDQGFNDYVCAGILGNMMTEASDGGLSLVGMCDTGNGYYGLCQWSLVYNTGIRGASVDYQLAYLICTMPNAFDNYGNVYEKDFSYEKFLKLDNERDAALAFAACYERCATYTYDVRLVNASIALEYFTN